MIEELMIEPLRDV